MSSPPSWTRAWPLYVPAIIVSTLPVVVSARVYVASTPLGAREILTDMVLAGAPTAVIATVLAYLPGLHRQKGVGLALAVLATGAYPSLAHALGVAPCTWSDAALGTGFVGILAWALVSLARRTDGVLESLQGFVLFLVLVFIVCAGYSFGLRARQPDGVENWSRLGGGTIHLHPLRPPPDVIHIVVDGMGRLDDLEATYGIDSRGATQALGAAGLRINASAVANYSQTYLAVGSVLSMDYLEQARSLATGDNDRILAQVVIDQGAAIRTLKEAGYRFTLLSSGYEALTEHPLADDGIMGPTLFGHFEGYLLPRTMLRVLPIRELTFRPHRQRMRAVLRALAAYAPEDRPRLILAHLLLPHPPFVFDAQGRDRTPPGIFTLADASTFPGTAAEFKSGYEAQARFVLSSLSDLLSRWSHLSRPPIVIVQGDHGSGLGYDMATPLGSNVSGRMKIFLGMKGLSGASDLPRSPVNIYRAILNQEFGTALPMLPDRSFVSSWGRPFDWTEVHLAAPAAGE